MQTEIQVDLSLVHAKQPLRALADVSIPFSSGTLRIHRCAVFEKSGQPAWVSLPRLLLEKQGKKYFESLIELPRELRERVFASILAEYGRLRDAHQNKFPGVLGPKSGQRPVGPDDLRQRTAQDARGPCAGAGCKGPAEKAFN